MTLDHSISPNAFTREFAELLDLNQDQISRINQLELELDRDYDFYQKIIKPSGNWHFPFYRRLLPLLTKSQILRLKGISLAKRKNKIDSEKVKTASSRHHLAKRFNSLDISTTQFDQMVLILKKMDLLRREKRGAKFGPESLYREIKDLTIPTV